MIKTPVLVIFLSILGVSYGQNIAKPKWNCHISKNNYKQGDTVDLVFTAAIPTNLFVYGPGTQCEIGPIKPSLMLSLEGAATLDSLYSETEKKSTDDIFGCLVGKWEKQAELRQRIVITSDTPVTYKGRLDVQYCDEKNGMCFMQQYEF